MGESHSTLQAQAPHRKRVRALLLFTSPVAALFNEGVSSGIALGAQSAMGDVIDSPLQRELALHLTTVREYATRVIHA